MVKNLTKQSTSDKAPEGKIIILAINAAKVEYAKQLNHLKIFEFSFIFSEVITPKILDEKVAQDVTNIASTTLVVIFFLLKQKLLFLQLNLQKEYTTLGKLYKKLAPKLHLSLIHI